MWLRVGFFEGKLHDAAPFVCGMEQQVIPAIRQSPGVKDVYVCWPRTYEDRDTAIFCQVVAQFDDEAGIAEMLASPERAATREQLMRLMPLFEGTLSHINFEVPD